MADAAAEIAAGPNTTGNYASVNFADPENNGGGGNFGGDVPFPSDTAADDEDFAVAVEATLEILLAGQYRLGFRGDDGSEMRIVGESFTDIVTDASGVAVIAADGALQVDMNTGDSTAEALIDLAVGTYALEALFWERGGGANFEIWGASPLTRMGTSCWSTVALASSAIPTTRTVCSWSAMRWCCSVTSNLDGERQRSGRRPVCRFWSRRHVPVRGRHERGRVVNGLDVDLFVAAVVGGGAAAVPEPSTMILAALAALALVGFGWRRTR